MFNINSKEDFLNKKIVISYQNKLELKQIIKVLADNFKDIVWSNGNKLTQLPIIARHNDGYLLIIDKKLYLSDACETDKCLLLSFSQFNNLIAELNVKPILDEVEKKYLWNIVKPFKDRVTGIIKRSYCNYEHIRIKGRSIFDDYNYFITELPDFKKGSMYKNMEIDREYTLKELGLIEPKKKKITLKAFFESRRALTIHCDTEEKANRLLKAFDKLGKTWCSGISYLSKNNYSSYKQEMCYTNNCCYASYDWCKRKCYKIYEFEDVDLEN